jgi:hypothetical protein
MTSSYASLSFSYFPPYFFVPQTNSKNHQSPLQRLAPARPSSFHRTASHRNERTSAFVINILEVHIDRF